MNLASSNYQTLISSPYTLAGAIADWFGMPFSSRRVRAKASAPSKGRARWLAWMPCSGARALGGTRVALLVLAVSVVGVAAGLDTCPAEGAAVVSPCAVAPPCNVSALHAGFQHTCALFSHGGVR